MARIDALPSLEIIRGLKGILDFYLWKGLPCVRAWPKYRPAKQTAASLAAALVFGAILKSYGLLGDLPLEAYRQDALDQTRTARDIMVTGVYGNLHEASMSDFLDLLVECRDFLSNLTTLLNALDSIDTDELVVNVDESVLPTGAATAAHQFTQNIALARIDDLADALHSRALDRLIVRGEDQLRSYKEDLWSGGWTWAVPAGDYERHFPYPPAHQVWLVTHILASNVVSAITRIRFDKRPGVDIQLLDWVDSPAAHSPNTWSGHIWLEHDSRITVLYEGCNLNDNLQTFIHGLKFTKET